MVVFLKTASRRKTTRFRRHLVTVRGNRSAGTRPECFALVSASSLGLVAEPYAPVGPSVALFGAMSSDDRVYGLHGEFAEDSTNTSESSRQSVPREVHPEPPIDVPGTRLSGSGASSGRGSDEGRDHQDWGDSTWRSYGWYEHDSWGNEEWCGQWEDHYDDHARSRDGDWRDRAGGDRRRGSRAERPRDGHDRQDGRRAPQADGGDRRPSRGDSDGRQGAPWRGSKTSSTTADESTFDPWQEAWEKRAAPQARSEPRDDPWNAYHPKADSWEPVWDGWQHFDYATVNDLDEDYDKKPSSGGQRPTEKLTIPSFNGEDDGEDVGTTARSYLRQVEAWRRMTRLPAEQQGLVLYQNLSGRAWVAAEELSVDKLSARNGVQYLIKWISGRYLDLEITRIGKAFSEFFRKLRRKAGQSIREYNAEYDRLHARLREVGCSLPEDCAAWLYVDRLQLEEAAELNLLASVGNVYSLHRLQKAAVIQDRGLRKPWEGANTRSKKAHHAHLTGHEETNSTDSEADNDEDDGIPEEVAQAYVTYQSAKQRYKDQQKSRGYVGDPGKNGGPEGRDEKLKLMKARSFCSGCGRRGHWHRDAECPKNKPGSMSGVTKPDVKEVSMCNILPAEIYATKYEGTALLGITDTACARTVAGTQWLQQYTDSLARVGGKPQLHKECEAYRFGTGKVHYSTFYVVLGFELGSKIVQVRTSIINGDVPLLLSKGVLSKLGMIYDVEQGRADFSRVGLKGFELQVTSSGHPAIPIVPAKVAGNDSAAFQAEDLKLLPREQYMVFALAHGSSKAPDHFNIFYDKKLDPGAKEMLCQEHLSHEAFLAWWKSTGTTSDFWLETPEAWIRVHMTPRKALFNPSAWNTRATLQKDMLLETVGEIRITEGVCCTTGRWIEPVVDRWESHELAEHSFNFLWAGRTWISKRYSPHSTAFAGQNGAGAMPASPTSHQPDDQGRALERSSAHGTGGTSYLGGGGDQGCDHGAPREGQAARPQRADEACDSYDPRRTEGEGRQPRDRLPLGRGQGQPHALDQGQPQYPGSRTDEDRKIQGVPVRRDPGELWRMGPSRTGDVDKPRPGVRDLRQVVPGVQAAEQGWIRDLHDTDPVRPRPRISGTGRSGDLGKIDEEFESGIERDGQVFGLGSGQRQVHQDKEAHTDGDPRGEGHGRGAGPHYRGGDLGPRDEDRPAEGQSPRQRDEVRQDGGRKADGLGGDALEDLDYDAPRFCDPNLGDCGRRPRDRKCCEVTSDVFTVSEMEFSESFLHKHNVFEHEYDTGSELSEYHDAMETDEEQEVFECRELTLEDEAVFLYDSGDFSFASLHELLEKAQNELRKFGTKREGVIRPETEVYCPFGAFVLGGVKGVTKATTEHTNLVRYLNAFAGAHIDDKATWSSVIVTKGAESKVHHDFHNMAGSSNYCASFGQEYGGELWIAAPGITDEEAEGKDIIWKRTGSGEWLPGRKHETAETFVKFDPGTKHSVLPSGGKGWHIVYYTTRGADGLVKPVAKFLKNCGFPLPRVTAPRRQAAGGRPRKTVRNSIGNVAGKLSVLFTTLMAAANSFLGESLATRPLHDPIVMFEIGGLDASLEATELGKAIMEPMSWDEYALAENKERAFHTVRAASPRELRIHLYKAPNEALEDVTQLVWEQLEGGGTVVLQGGDPDLVIKGCPGCLQYRGSHEDGDWTVLAKPKNGEKFVPGDLVPHQVCVVDDHGRANAPHHERPLRLDGSGIRFGPGTPMHIQSALKRLHQNLGHPRNEDMLRHLRLAGCDSHILKAVRGMSCETCAANSQPRAPRPATMPRMQDFAETVGMDILYAHDVDDHKHTFLSILDLGTTYHIVVPIASTSSTEIEKAFNDFWITPYGPPSSISIDLETGLQSGVARLCGWHGIRVKSAAAQAHWQAGMVERQGQWWKSMWARVCHELSVTSSEVKLTATVVSAAKNTLRRRCGHSPVAWVFGREARLPAGLRDPDGGERVSFDVSNEAKFQREAAIRASARIAFHKSEGDAKLRRALLQRARATTRPFEHGETVHYWHKPKDRRQGHWEGPAVVVGQEGGSYWIARGGRCRLTAPEHLRPSGPEESGEYLSMAGVKHEVEKLLSQDLDAAETYEDEDDEAMDDEDPADHMSDYVPSNAEAVDEYDKDDDDDTKMQEQSNEAPVVLERMHPSRRVKRKAPSDSVEWDAHQTENFEVMMMMRRRLTRRGLEKRQEKELRWSEIPSEHRHKFREAEEKQWREHLHFDALEPLDDQQTSWVKANIAAERVLDARWAYKDKNWARRRQGDPVEWKCKSRLVIAGHKDPDLQKGQLSTDSPTISRPGLLCLLQILANGLQGPDPWRVAAGDIQCAFLTGSYLSRDEELFIHQPATGFPGMSPGQLVRVKKNIFGLATSPREWWEDLQRGFRNVLIEFGDKQYKFDQCPLDPCIFTLREFRDGVYHESPLGYVGTHVDDLLVVAPGSVSELIQNALSKEFPIDDWESQLFNYLGSEISYTEEEVTLSQRAYSETRLFKLDLPNGAGDEEPAGEDLIADNRSLVGALSWLSAQTRPDLTCSVSMAQQLQKHPTIGDLRFSNAISKKAYDHKDEGLRFRSLQVDNMVVLVYHDAGWANAKDTEHDEESFQLTAEDKASGLQTEGPFAEKSNRKAKKDNSKVASQLGDLVVFTDRGCLAGVPSNFGIIDWKSRAGQRVCRSTFSAETQACVEGVEAGQHVRALFETLLSGDLVKVEDASIPLYCLSDCRSLYDHVHKQGLPRVPADRRLAVDLAALRQALKREQWSHKLPLGWVPSAHQLSDVLTKPQDPTSWWESVKQKLLVPVIVTGDAPSCKRLKTVRKTSVNPYGVCVPNSVRPFEFCISGGLPEDSIP